jgi:hypothetical protein
MDKKEEAFEDGRQVWEKQDTIWDEILGCIHNYRQPNCPKCKKGWLHFAGIVRMPTRNTDKGNRKKCSLTIPFLPEQQKIELLLLNGNSMPGLQSKHDKTR